MGRTFWRACCGWGGWLVFTACAGGGQAGGDAGTSGSTSSSAGVSSSGASRSSSGGPASSSSGTVPSSHGPSSGGVPSSSAPASSGAGSPGDGPSCAGGPACAGMSCCARFDVPGGAFQMGRSDTGNDACPAAVTCYSGEIPEHAATVSTFSLDAFEVSVGRFRNFVNQYDGTPPSAGAGAHPRIANSGWQAEWNGLLADSQASLRARLACSTSVSTWSDAPGAGEDWAINCVDWFTAFAFCAWDGGRLPTEAEWEYAAAGGDENRLYPWGSAYPGASQMLANFGYATNPTPFVAVGSYPAGAARWGHHDMAGGVREWTLDGYDAAWYANAGSTCTDCANLVTTTERVCRGGAWSTFTTSLRPAYRSRSDPAQAVATFGLRCARDVP